VRLALPRARLRRALTLLHGAQGKTLSLLCAALTWLRDAQAAASEPALPAPVDDDGASPACSLAPAHARAHGVTAAAPCSHAFAADTPAAVS
jgi:hypothetical protein